MTGNGYASTGPGAFTLDMACEEALYDSASLRRFVGIDLGREPVPDSTTISVVKRLRGFGKVRYRGLPKNATRAFTALALALANIYLGRQSLMAQVRP